MSPLPAGLWVLLVCCWVILVDQFTKSWARNQLKDRDIELVGSVEFVLGYNRGVAFGLGDGVAPVLVTIAIVGFLAFLVSRRLAMTRPVIVAVGLVLGGAAGNLADRLFRDTDGAVVDFIKVFDWWPVFNIADSCIVVGAVMLVLGSSQHSDHSTSVRTTDGDTNSDEPK